MNEALGRIEVNVLIIGGGVTGLWLLNELRKAENPLSVLLLEKGQLGGGQTCHSHVYIHGGYAYSALNLISGLKDARTKWESWLNHKDNRMSNRDVVCERQAFWGFNNPADAQRKRALWDNAGLECRVIAKNAWPEALQGDSSVQQVYRIPERWLEGKSLVEELIRGQEGHIIRIDSITSIRVDDADAEYPHVQSVQVVMPDGNQITILPGCLVLAAGMGNGTLLDLATGGKHTLMARFGEQQQLRKAHMLIVRGETLPELVGVFPDSRGLFIVNRKDAGRNVWLVSDYSSPAVGSAIDWIDRSTSAWLKPVILQLKVLSPRVFSKLDDLEFAVYEAPKAEGRAMGKLPSSPVINKVGANFWAVWPSKLTLAPLASDMLVAAIRALHLRPVPHAVNPGCQCAEAAPELWTKQNLVQWEQFSRVHDLKEVEYAATAAV